MPDMEIIRQLANDIGADTALTLMGMFKDDADKRVQAIRDYLADVETGKTGDLRDLRLNAHSLKGLCRTYGATAAGDLAMELQDACDTGEDAAIQAKAQAALDVIPGDVDAAIEAVRTLAGESA